MDFLTDQLFAEFGRSDFIGGIDNEALDFGHLEQFIHVATSTSDSHISPRVSPIGVHDVAVAPNSISIQSHLPESPPDSGSEPPFSPVDLPGLTLTSRSATSNCASTHDGSLVDANIPHDSQQHIKSTTELQPLTYSHHNIQHNHNIHQHIYVEHNDQHSLLLAATPQHQQPVHHAESTIASPTSVASDIYSPDNRAEHDMEHSGSHQLHQRPQTNNNIQVTSEIISMEAQRASYNRQIMMITPRHQHHSPSIITPDVYIGTSSAVIEPTTEALLPKRKRKISQVDCCESSKTIKPEVGVSPICHQKLNPTSPVTINLQQIGALAVEAASGSPSSSSLSPTATSLSLSNDNNSLDGGGAGTPHGALLVNSNATDSSSESSPMQCIRFSPFQQHNWHTLCDQSLQELTMAHYRVDADKGFNFSVSDDAFVCQKKNHFQITCHARLQGEAKFVRTPTGLEKIKSFHLHFYGVKLEAPNQTIRVEQSQSDRSKKPFYPVPIDLQSHLVSKVTVGRLHFSETTNNNMRKKGRPNPEQRYFQLVVGLHVHTHSGHFPVASQGSERIIVRASNPGQFESDVELCWQRGITPESIFHAGRVGINTDRPDESLVIHGNLKVSGHIIQPSDSRAKQEISELDTAVQLRNLQKIRIVRYRYEPEFAIHSGLKSDKDNEEIIDTGVIAQEVREVLPDAVQEAGSIVLPSGQIIENFLLVNKDRILMENIGAVKELCKVTGSLETRIEQLEKINNRLMRMQEVGQRRKKIIHDINDGVMEEEDEMCSNRTIQMMIIILVIIMATCLVAVSTLYFVEHSKQRYMKRYDRYDISHHLVSHDAILINNNNNPRNHNYNGYHTNKNGKLILHTHTSRPPLAPHLPILSESQQSSNFPLKTQPSDNPISVIDSSYPSTGSDSAFNIHGTNTDTDVYKSIRSETIDERPDEELPQTKTDSSVSTPATNHRSNKTGSSKNKSKWPLSETTATVSSSITLAYHFNDDPIEDNINASETSSEKVADSIPLPQDFESNSIDGSETSQKPEAHGRSHNPNLPIDIGTIASTTTSPETSVFGVAAIGIGAVKIDSSVDSSSSSSSSSIFVVYKKSPGKIINDTISQPVNFTIETPPITNKSRGIDTEDADLQYLGNNNDSDDQSLVEIASVPMIAKTFALSPIGIPDHCMKIKREEISNCQSACFEDTNNLPSQTAEIAIRRRHIQILTPRNSTTIMSARSTASFTSGHTNSIRKQQSVIDGSSDTTASIERIPVDEIDGNQENGSSKSQQGEIVREELTTSFKDKKQPHKDSKRKIDSIEVLSVDDPTPSSDCSSVTPWLQADTFNVSLGCEEICLNGGSSLNITYMIPLSKYLKDTNVELHFVAPANLHWSICSNKEKTKQDGSSILNPLNNGKIFQKSQNVSILHLIIPGHGHFERLIELRAAMDSTKNLCREQVDETNVLLQYNIRIVRDCD